MMHVWSASILKIDGWFQTIHYTVWVIFWSIPKPLQRALSSFLSLLMCLPDKSYSCWLSSPKSHLSISSGKRKRGFTFCPTFESVKLVTRFISLFLLGRSWVKQSPNLMVGIIVKKDHSWNGLWWRWRSETTFLRAWEGGSMMAMGNNLRVRLSSHGHQLSDGVLQLRQ